jgi:signal transduction histidine kinase
MLRERVPAALPAPAVPAPPLAESRNDRTALAQRAGLRRLSVVSIAAGTLSAFGALAFLLGVGTAIAAGAGLGANASDRDWQGIGAAAAAASVIAIGMAFFFGGYVAGRMGRRAGLSHGAWVFLAALVLFGGGVTLVAWFADAEFERALHTLGIPLSWDAWSSVGLVACVGAVLAMLWGSLVGGHRGERWHATLITRALRVPTRPS